MAASPEFADALEAESDDDVKPSFASKVELAGATRRISGKVRRGAQVTVGLTLDAEPGEDDWVGVALASSPKGPWEVVPAKLTPDRKAVTFTPPHFSWFTPFFVNTRDLLGEMRTFVDDLSSGATAEARAPSCSSEADARTEGWKVSSVGPDTLKWCFGMRDGVRVLTAVNARRYYLSLSHKGAEEWERPRVPWTDFAKLSRDLSPKLTLLPPRTSVTYRITGPVTVRSDFDGVAQSLYRLQVGVELAASFLSRFGYVKGEALWETLGDVLSSSGCLGALSEPSGGDVIQRCFSDPTILTKALGWKGTALAAFMAVSSVVEYFRSDLNALGDQLNGRSRYVIRVSHVQPPVLGASDLLDKYAEGWGEVAPSVIFNGGVPSGRVSDIRWSNWGATTATATGLNPIYRPEGGYYDEPAKVELRATRLGTCPGDDAPAYTRLLVRGPDEPGGALGPWRPWTLDLCKWAAEPQRCGQVTGSANSDNGAFDLTAWDTTCATARSVAQAVLANDRVNVTSEETLDLTAAGFACRTYGNYSDDLPSLNWQCTKETASVTFDQS